MILVDICIAITDKKFEYICAVLKGEVLEQYLAENPKVDLYEISEDILYNPNYYALYDNSTKTIPIFQDIEMIKEQLAPLQKELNEKILCSTLIHTPEKLKNALKENPRAHLKKVRSSNIASPPESEEFLPIYFQDFGDHLLGWQHPAILLQQYDLAYGIDPKSLEAKHESKELKRYSDIMHWQGLIGMTQFHGEFLVHRDKFEFIGALESREDHQHFFIPFDNIKNIKYDRVTLVIATQEKKYDFSIETFKEDPRRVVQFMINTVNAYRKKSEAEA